MLNADTKAMGLIFPNSFDSYVPEMVEQRLMASVPFASRYRLVDFMLSSLSNCGIDKIGILPNKNYLSLMDHIGTGREWDLARKNGGVQIFPPFSERGTKIAAGRVEAIANIISHLKRQKEKYVVLCDTNIAVNFDFEAMIEAHVATGADVTIAYNEQEMPKGFVESGNILKDLCYSFEIVDGRITEINVNKAAGVQNLSMNIFVIERELLINLVQEAYDHGLKHFTRDVLWNNRNELNIQGYKYEGYVARIMGLQSYLEENMKLLDRANLDALFESSPICTKVRDDNPTRYISGSKVKNSMLADGCVIEGEVEDCVLFRGVKIGKGAKVKNCILMQDTVVEAGANLEYIITDKSVVISEGKEMKGADTYPTYIAKKARV